MYFCTRSFPSQRKPGKSWRMWVLLLFTLLCLGPTILSGVLTGIFVILSKAGLLSGIRAGNDGAKLDVQIHGVQMSVWRNLPPFLLQGARGPIIRLSLTSIQVCVDLPATFEGRQGEVGDKKQMKSEYPIHDLRHPMWASCNGSITLLHHLQHYLDLVSVHVEDFELAITRQKQPLASIKDGSMSVSIASKTESDEICCQVHLNVPRRMKIHLEAINGNLELGSIALSVVIPFFAGELDTRSPIPTLCELQCSSINMDLVFHQLLQMLGNHCPKSDQAQDRVINSSDLDAMYLESVKDALTVLQEIPTKVAITVENLEARVHYTAGREDSRYIVGRVSRLSTRFKPKLCQDGIKNSAARRREELGEATIALQKVEAHCGGTALIKTDNTFSPSEKEIMYSRSIEVSLSISKSQAYSHMPNNTDLSSYDVTCDVRGEELTATLRRDLQPWTTLMLKHAKAPRKQSLNEQRPQGSQDISKLLGGLNIRCSLRLLHTTAVFMSELDASKIIPSGVPNIRLLLEEINGRWSTSKNGHDRYKRAEGEIQVTNSKLEHFRGLPETSFCMLFLDHTRLLLHTAPTQSVEMLPAQVEMESEWLEAAYSAESLHAIGGAMQLGIVLFAPAFQIKGDGLLPGPRPLSPFTIPTKKTLEIILKELQTPSVCTKFQCQVNHVRLFICSESTRRMEDDFLSIDCLHLRSSPGCFQIAFEQVGIYAGSTTGSTNVTMDQCAPYFTVKSFALEETAIPHSTKTIVDLFLDDIYCDYTISEHIRVVNEIRKITYANWQMLYLIRSAFARNCMPPESRFNRKGGLNQPLANVAECIRLEELLYHQVSASGNNLTRLMVTNLRFNAPIAPKARIYLTVGVLSGDDLPNLWLIQNVSLQCNDLEIISLNQLDLRRTLDKRTDYVMGEFEANLRLRQSVCNRNNEELKVCRDGMMVGLHDLKLQTSLDFHFIDFVHSMQDAVEPFVTSFVNSMQMFWRPQEDEFFHYYLRLEKPNERMQLWLTLNGLEVSCQDNWMETWLESKYPLWLDVLSEQEAREQVYTTKENAPLLDINAVHSYRYRQKLVAPRKTNAEPVHSTALFKVTIPFLKLDLAFPADEVQNTRLVESLDEAMPVIERSFDDASFQREEYTLCYEILERVEMDLSINGLCVNVRQFPTALVACNDIDLTGNVVVALPYNPAEEKETSLHSTLKVYVSLDLTSDGFMANFAPAYTSSLAEIGDRVLCLSQRLSTDQETERIVAPWDILRSVLHGKVTISVPTAGVRVYNSLHAFECNEYLEASIQNLSILCEYGGTKIALEQVAINIYPLDLYSVVELSNVDLVILIEWECDGYPNNHYHHPLQYLHATNDDHDVCFCIDTCTLVKRRERLETWKTDTTYNRFRATSMKCTVSGRIGGDDVTAYSPQKHCNLSKKAMAARATVLLYTKQMEWLLNFANTFIKWTSSVTNQIHRARKGQKSEPSWSQHLPVISLMIDTLTVEGIDIGIYDDEQCVAGIRVSVNDRLTLSRFQVTSAEYLIPETEAPSNHLLLFWTNELYWEVTDIKFLCQDFEVRVCTPVSGSRGEPFVWIKSIAIISQSPHIIESFKNLRTNSPTKRHRRSGHDESTKTILNHFQIEHLNPYSFRDTEALESEGSPTRYQGESTRSKLANFGQELLENDSMLGMNVDETRVTASITALDSLAGIGMQWTDLILCFLADHFWKWNDTDKPVQTEPIIASPRNFGSKPMAKTMKLSELPQYRQIFNNTEETSGDGHSQHENETEAEDKVCPDTSLPSYFLVKCSDTQLSFQDEKSKGSLLVVVACAKLCSSHSLDENHMHLSLQVSGAQAYTAPLDIDVKSRTIWLEGFGGSPTSTGLNGLLSQVLKPMPITLFLCHTGGTEVANTVSVHIPSAHFGIGATSKKILEQLLDEMEPLVDSKVAQMKEMDIFGGSEYTSSRLSAVLENGKMDELMRLRSDIKWEISQLEYNEKSKRTHQWQERLHYYLDVNDVESNTLEETQLIAKKTDIAQHEELIAALRTYLSRRNAVAQMKSTKALRSREKELRVVTAKLWNIDAEAKRRQTPPVTTDVRYEMDEANLILRKTSTISILRLVLKDTCTRMKVSGVRSALVALSLGQLRCQNLQPDTPLPDILLPLKNAIGWGEDTFLRVDAEIVNPVEGALVVRHFEVNVHPVQVFLTHDIVQDLALFFSSTERVASAQELRQRQAVREMFLDPYTRSQSRSDVGSTLKRAAGKAASLSKKSSQYLRRGGTDQLSKAEIDKETIRASQSKSQLEGTMDMESESESEEEEEGGEVEKGTKKEASGSKKTGIVFKHVRVGTLDAIVTYKNQRSLLHAQQTGLEEMRGFQVKVHALVYSDKTCTMKELLLRMRRDIILDILSQVGRNFSNIANVLRDQFGSARWAKFDTLAPLRSRSSTQKSLKMSLTPGDSGQSEDGKDIEAREASSTAPLNAEDVPSMPSTPSTPSETMAKFFLGLPDNHPSLRKKNKFSWHRSLDTVQAGDLASPSGVANTQNSFESRIASTLEHEDFQKHKSRLKQLFSKKPNVAHGKGEQLDKSGGLETQKTDRE